MKKILTVFLLLSWNSCFSQQLTAEACSSLPNKIEKSVPAKNTAFLLRKYAECFIKGIGVKKNPSRAIELLARAIENGDKAASHILASLRVFGSNRLEDQKKGLKTLFQEFHDGSKFSAGKIGTAYYNGLGVSKDVNKAIRYYKIAAQGGITIYQFILAHIYDKGYYGQEKNLEMVNFWKSYKTKIHIYNYECKIYNLYLEGLVFPDNDEEKEKYRLLCESLERPSV